MRSSEAPARLQDRLGKGIEKGPNPAGFQRQSIVAIGPLAAIVRADFVARNAIAPRTR
jgi:hypothetical protein